MSGEKNLTKLLASMTPVLSDKEFVFGTLKKVNAELLVALEPIGTFWEKEGLTVILPKEKAQQFNVESSGIFKCITLNIHSSLEAVGLTAAVSTKLAEANISANVVAAYYHDYIFMPINDADKALASLKSLVEESAL